MNLSDDLRLLHKFHSKFTTFADYKHLSVEARLSRGIITMVSIFWLFEIIWHSTYSHIEQYWLLVRGLSHIRRTVWWSALLWAGWSAGWSVGGQLVLCSCCPPDTTDSAAACRWRQSPVTSRRWWPSTPCRTWRCSARCSRRRRWWSSSRRRLNLDGVTVDNRRRWPGCTRPQAQWIAVSPTPRTWWTCTVKHRLSDHISHSSVILNYTQHINPLMGTSNYSATLNNMKLVHWPLIGGLLHLVQRREDWAEPQPA